jgi:hypothetical protein
MNFSNNLYLTTTVLFAVLALLSEALNAEWTSYLVKSNNEKPSLLLKALASKKPSPSESSDSSSVSFTQEQLSDTGALLLYRIFQNIALNRQHNLVDNLIDDEPSEVAEPKEKRRVHADADEEVNYEVIKNRNESVRMMEKKLTEKQKKMITDAFSQNFVNKLKNMYVITARSR